MKYRFTGISRMASQSLVLPAHVANRTFPPWVLSYLTVYELRSCSRPDATFNSQLEDRMATKMISRLYTLCAGMCTSLKSNIVMTHDQRNNLQEQLSRILG